MTGPDYRYLAVVEHVVDGDTIDVAIDLGFRIQFRTRLRIAGIDAPERYTDEGKHVLAYVQQAMPVGCRVLVRTYKPDKYGRALADVEFTDLDGEPQDLATHLVGQGMAVPYDGGAR